MTAAVLIATFGLTIVQDDLTYGIVAGCVLAAVFAILHRSIPTGWPEFLKPWFASVGRCLLTAFFGACQPVRRISVIGKSEYPKSIRSRSANDPSDIDQHGMLQ